MSLVFKMCSMTSQLSVVLILWTKLTGSLENIGNHPLYENAQFSHKIAKMSRSITLGKIKISSGIILWCYKNFICGF